MRRKLLACGLTLLALGVLTLGAAQAQTTEIRREIGENDVAYPQLEGMADEAVQQKINDDIVTASGVTNHLVTLVTLGQSPWGLQVDYEITLETDDAFSLVISAKGKMPNGREGQAYSALTYNLVTGERLTLEALFTDVDAAVSAMEKIAEESLAEELSGYLANSQITPLPRDAFTLDADGITFWYPGEQLSLLSGYSGACQFYYEEVAPYLLDGEDELPKRLGLLQEPLTPTQAKAAIVKSVEAGRLPHVPIALGDPMKDVVEKYRLTRTPDAFPGGRYFVMEAPAFRSVLVISDAIQSGYETSLVEGIQVKRGNLYGLAIGATERSGWLSLLGEPDETMPFTENMAYDYNLPQGQSDLYHYGAYELRLHADTDGVLRAIQLCK